MVNLQKGLVGHWTLDSKNTNNGTAYDSSAYDNHGNLLGTYTTENSSPISESVYFDGTSGSRMDSSKSITIGQSNWTVSSWIYPYSFNDYLHILSEPNQNEFTCKVATGDGEPYFYTQSDRTSGSEASESLDSNSWNHVVYRYNGDEISIFKNSNQIVSNLGNTLDIPTQTYRIQGGNEEYQEAEHSDTRLYLRSLSQSEISALYNMRSQRRQSLGEFHEFFESGDFSNVENFNSSIVTDRVYRGSNSAYSNNNGSNQQFRFTYGTPTKPSYVSFWVQETGNSYGSGMRIKNSNGNYELGVALDNPQWDIEDNNGWSQTVESGNYDQWVNFNVYFDWDNSQFDVYIEQPSSSTSYRSNGRPLINGTDMEYIEFWNYHTASWGDGNIQCWWDDILVVR